MTHVVRVELAKRGDWFIATSKSLPGFLVSHPNAGEFYKEIPEAIKLFFRARLQTDVIVREDSPVIKEPLNTINYIAEAA